MTFTQLVNHIETYCSDTFGAESSEITHTESIKVAQYLIQEMVNKHVDGLMIRAILDDMRDRDL